MKKAVVHEEVVYVLANVLLSLAVAMAAASDFGVSMIVGPAYIISTKFTFLTFGQAEYLLQALLFTAFCILMKKVKLTYFFAFFTCVFYGFILDLWRSVVPFLNPNIVTPGDFSMPIRIALYVGSLLLTAISVAMFFKIFPPPQVYDYFVKMRSRAKGIPTKKYKTCFDLTCLAVSLILTFSFFGEIRCIGIGTIITAFVNGTLIGFFEKLLGRYFEFVPLFPKIKEKF